MKPTHAQRFSVAVSNTLLMALVLAMVAVIPSLPAEWHRLGFSLLYSAMFVTAALTIDKGGKTILMGALVLVVVEAAAAVFQMRSLDMASKILNIGFFMLIVGLLIAQVAGTTKVTAIVILEAINAYLLLGIAFSLLVAVVTRINPTAFGFGESVIGPAGTVRLSECIYFAFVTLTTLGYGDVTPHAPFAKSLSVLIAVAGQIYVAVIIAMLVGKFSSEN